MVLIVATILLASAASAATRMDRYYAYAVVEDRHGVIAPWYTGQNGQWDFRVRIAAETLKRYPWTDTSCAVAAAPEFVFSGAWNIAPDGTITIPPIEDWANGDLGQRAAYVLSGLVDYYRYSGDPAAIALLSVTADTLLDHCQTGHEHPWPRILISVPVKGKPYGKCDPNGMIQLDIVAEVGLGLVRAYQVTGNTRWRDTAKHWADLFAEHCEPAPDRAPWLRYANPEAAPWPNVQMTGGVVFILAFLDEVIRLGYAGEGDALLLARDAGRDYLRNVLLPNWTVNDVWGRNYWDWANPVQAENVTEFAVRYFMENAEVFPNWRNDARNIMGLFLNHACVSPKSNGDVFSGAWAYPEGCGCCGRSLWYGPMEFATVYAQYGVLARSAWGREVARRQQILATYDCKDTGVVEDNIDGGCIVAGAWFKIAHPMALKHVLGTMAWMPEVLGAARENHIMRSSSVVRSVVYGKGRVSYETFDAPANTVDVLRLAFEPAAVLADDTALPCRDVVDANGYAVQRLASGDAIVSIRHDGLTHIEITGADPQKMADDAVLTYSGNWRSVADPQDHADGVHVASTAGADMRFTFSGNQVRLLGRVGPDGGLADVYLDDAKQLVAIDCRNPAVRRQQVLYYRNGLAPGEHTIRVVVRGACNPVSQGNAVYVDAVQWSSAVPADGGAPETAYGSGGGPTDTQRMVCGYTGRKGYVDTLGKTWLPATEFVARVGHMADSVVRAWTTTPRAETIEGTSDPELYRYGIHADEFWVNVTVGPGVYYVRLKFAETVEDNPKDHAVTVHINGREVVSAMDVAATAGGLRKAVDVVFNDVHPEHGIIEIRFSNPFGMEAMVQAIEVGPGHGGEGATPVSVAADAADATGNLLLNPGLESGVPEMRAREGATSTRFAWTCTGIGPNESYVYPESVYVKHPKLGLPDLHSGKEALRTHSSGGGHTEVYQETGVQPNSEYTASVWVKTVDLAGQGFGAHPGDSAGLVVAELAADGRVLAEHASPVLTKAGPYQPIETAFTASEETVKVRFILRTLIACSFEQGHVAYDDCRLACSAST